MNVWSCVCVFFLQSPPSLSPPYLRGIYKKDLLLLFSQAQVQAKSDLSRVCVSFWYVVVSIMIIIINMDHGPYYVLSPTTLLCRKAFMMWSVVDRRRTPLPSASGGQTSKCHAPACSGHLPVCHRPQTSSERALAALIISICQQGWIF